MGRPSSYVRVAGVALVLALATSLPALAASAKPDAHDRALAAQLDARVATFRAIAGSSGGTETKSLDKCPYLKKHPKQAFAAAFALLPAMLADVVNTYKPELVGLQSTLAGLHPDSPLFARWLAELGQEFSVILSLDNHGKKIDLCQAAVVMLAKKTTAADVKRVLGIDPSAIAKLFTSPVNSNLSKLDPKMKTFFVQAGLSVKDATTLTS
jgi:hypothetical protein